MDEQTVNSECNHFHKELKEQLEELGIKQDRYTIQGPDRDMYTFRTRPDDRYRYGQSHVRFGFHTDRNPSENDHISIHLTTDQPFGAEEGYYLLHLTENLASEPADYKGKIPNMLQFYAKSDHGTYIQLTLQRETEKDAFEITFQEFE